MSNLDKAVEVLCEAYREPSMSPVHACDIMANALQAAGLLMPDVQIIRTVKELEALDVDTWLMQADEDAIPMVVDDWIHDYNFDGDGIFPLVVMMDGAQVRVAREAMEQEHG